MCFFFVKKRGYNLILVSTEELKEELKLLSTHIERTFLIRTVTVIYRWNSPSQPLELTTISATTVEGTWSTATPPTVGQIPLARKFHRAGSFDRLETIETIARNANLVLYINCTRPFNDQNLSKTLNPAEFQSIVNNYLIPPMQLAYIVSFLLLQIEAETVVFDLILGSSIYVYTSSSCLCIKCCSTSIMFKFNSSSFINNLF